MKELARKVSVVGIAILIGAACGDEPASATSILVTFERRRGASSQGSSTRSQSIEPGKPWTRVARPGFPTAGSWRAMEGSTRAGISRTSSWWM
jgi:hypothetical protein